MKASLLTSMPAFLYERLRRIRRMLMRALLFLRRPEKLFAQLRYSLFLGKCGQGCDFETHMLVRNPHNVFIGDRCSFSSFVVLDAHDRIEIGNDCMFAVRVTISTATHDYRQRPASQRTITKSVIIGNDVWLGVGSTVLPGVRVGDGAVIGAHALVTEDVPPDAIMVGVPARLLKFRDRHDLGCACPGCMRDAAGRKSECDPSQSPGPRSSATTAP